MVFTTVTRTPISSTIYDTALYYTAVNTHQIPVIGRCFARHAMSVACNIRCGGCYTNGDEVRVPATLRAGGGPRLNFSSEGHGADQGERHQDGGEEAEETMGNFRFHNHITFLYLSFCGTCSGNVSLG